LCVSARPLIANNGKSQSEQNKSCHFFIL